MVSSSNDDEQVAGLTWGPSSGSAVRLLACKFMSDQARELSVCQRAVLGRCARLPSTLPPPGHPWQAGRPAAGDEAAAAVHASSGQACACCLPQGYGYTSNAVACLDYCLARGADIISASWSAGTAPNPPLEEAVGRAERRGVLLVAAAGGWVGGRVACRLARRAGSRAATTPRLLEAPLIGVHGGLLASVHPTPGQRLLPPLHGLSGNHGFYLSEVATYPASYGLNHSLVLTVGASGVLDEWADYASWDERVRANRGASAFVLACMLSMFGCTQPLHRCCRRFTCQRRAPPSCPPGRAGLWSTAQVGRLAPRFSV